MSRRAYRHAVIGELQDQQARFAPLERRIEQVDRAEELLAELVPHKRYPYQYVFFRITGFRTRSHPELVMTGDDLQHDLRLFVEELSESTRMDVSAAREPVLTIEELSRQMGVSTKTISRWRNQGLVSRKFVVGGRKRVGFLKSSVDRFVARNEQRIDGSSRFSQLTMEEKERIVSQARRMAAGTSGRRTDIIRRLARRLGRSPETIRYTIRNHDRQNPDRAVFGSTSAPLGPAQRAQIYRAYQAGEPVAELARRFRRTRSSIYRIINQMRAEELLGQSIEYVYNPEFDQPGAADRILAPMPPGNGPGQKSTKAPRGLPPYLASLYEVPLLTKEQEVYLFRKMNFLKHQAYRLQQSLRPPARPRAAVLDQIQQLLTEAQEVKKQITRANLRLVVSIAKRHVSYAHSFDELISDGNLSLMRAVDRFDFARGNKFSTYASWAIMKNYARSIPAEQHQRDRYVTGQEELFSSAADTRSDEHRYINELKEMRQSVSRILQRLDERERSVIVSRFGLEQGQEPQTLEQVGHALGVTKERVRQLAVRAMGKLRRYAEEERIELPEP